ncbi:MAG: EAL domain-containing protein [Oscillospiraceae bacterium]|nr:EAL domain-containing protein [Oscillospiraceae bacterium]
MKTDVRHVLIAVIIPALLLTALVGFFWQLQAVTITQISSIKDWLSPTSFAISLLLALVFVAIFGVISIWRDIRIDKEQAKYKQVCTIDPLTGLYNKEGFVAEVSKELTQMSKSRVCALLSFEIVSFRTYNELYGYEAGDVLLKTIADIALKNKKTGDVVGRLYSDHFIWFANGEESEEIFATFRSAIKEAKDTGLPFYLCGGIYLIEDHEMTTQSIIDKASLAKETIKYNFGTGISIYDDSMLECQMQDAQMVGSMMKGLQNGEFIEYYQPKYYTDTETIIGAEALARWKKPDGEIITPSRFAGLFERNGFIRRLDFYIFERVCSFLADAQANNKPVLPVSVNFSRVHIHDLHFPQRLLALTQKYGVDTKCLEIELTESAYFIDTKNINRVVDLLHEYGFTVAIDDFGSGFSSLNMLKDSNFDILKIDANFLEGFERGGRAGTVVTSVMRMAKWLGIPVVAEGVETREQVDFLRTLGCEMIQGYYYSRPVPRYEYEKLLDNMDSITLTKEKPTVTQLGNINAVFGADSLVNSILDGVFGGFGIYELSGKSMEAIRVNKAYYELMGYPSAEAFREHSLNIMTRVYPKDADKLLNACIAAIRTQNQQKVFISRYKYDGSLIQLDCLIKHIGGTEDKALICMTVVDAVERLRAEREEELNKYADALNGIFDEIFEFNYKTDVLRLLSRNHVKCYEERNLEETEERWLNSIFHPDDKDKIYKLMTSARANEIKLPFETEYREIVNGETRWISTSMVSIAGGSYLLCNLDITQKKQLEMIVESADSIRKRMELDIN